MNRAIPPGCKDDFKKAQQLEKQKQFNPSAIVSLIQLYDQILTRFSSNQFPYFYSYITSKMGNAYWKLPTGNRLANLKFTIACYQEALRYWTLKRTPLDYARTQYSLGIVYYELSKLSLGDRIANLRCTIACYQEALRYWTLKRTPLDHARTQYSLGRAYSDLGELPTQDRTANLQYTVACYQEALRCWTPKMAPIEYAGVQNSLGIAYCKLSELPMFDRITNLESAIFHFKKVLHFWTPKTAPFEYAGVQKNLGMAYYALSKLLLEDRIDNLKRAIACYREALRFQTPETAPLDFASTQNSLGGIYHEYSKLLLGDRTINLEHAIACYQEALRFQTPETAPLSYAKTQHNLGIAYRDLVTGNRIANLERAIACFQEALRFQTPETTPLSYASTQNCLGATYQDLSEQPTAIQNYYANVQQYLEKASIGESEQHLTTLRVSSLEDTITDTLSNPDAFMRDLSKQQGEECTSNMKRAIACFQEALRYYTPETAPLDYASTQNFLGQIYRSLSKQVTENCTINLERAITCYQEALRFYTSEVDPIECRRVTSNLAFLYFMLKDWKTALSYFRDAIDVGERIYQAGILNSSKTKEIAKNSVLYQRATFSAARCGKPTEALLILERGKTRLLTEALGLRIPRPANVPDLVWRTFEDAGATLRAAQAQEITIFEDERLHGETNKDREQVIQATNAALDTAIQQVRLYAPDFLKTVTLEEIQHLISESHTVLIAFCLTEQGSMGFITGHQGKHVEVVEMPTFTLTDLNHLFITQSYGGEFANGWLGSYLLYQVQQSPEAFKDWQSTMTHVLETLGRELLWGILSRLPPNITQITFLPANLLFLFPLHAVPLSSGSTKLVCDRFQVRYAPSIEVLANIKAKAAREVFPHLYAVINPEVDSHLPFTFIEGQAIAKLFPHSHIDEGRVGTKDNVVAGMRESNYVHFSCHSSYNWYNPISSGVSLADGSLTLAELQQGVIDLSRARLLTLSACETGISDVILGSAEEYLGLPAGFLIAGVPCVVSSLWAVPDLSTTLLMERFYRNHLEGGMEFAVALREAQAWVRDLGVEAVADYAARCYRQSNQRIKEKKVLFVQMRHYRYLAKQNPTFRPFAHPYYWAAFTVNGW